MPSVLAMNGGKPVRDTLLPYSRPLVDDEDVVAVTKVLQSEWLTTGPKVAEFEEAFAAFVGTKHAVAVSSGTAAVHAAIFALRIAEGDEVIVPAMTFSATANAVVFQGGTPVFVDSEPGTILIDPEQVAQSITKKTRAIIAVDYSGQTANYDALRPIAEKHGLTLVADACHALGGTDNGRKVGSLGDMSTFSFHAVKPIATGEGGMITTDNAEFAARMRHFRNHGLTSDHRERHNAGSWHYEMHELGYNYRLTDIQCALGISQLKKVPQWTLKRQAIAKKYDTALRTCKEYTPLTLRSHVSHAYHLYIILLELNELSADRAEIFRALRAENIGVNVHYIPVHLHAYYQQNFGTRRGMFPVAEAAYDRMLSIPVFAGMTDSDANDVITALEKVCTHYRKG